MKYVINKNDIFKNIRFKIEDVLTDNQIKKIKQKVYKLRLRKAYKYDENILLKYSFGFVKDYDFDNLRGKLTLHYHSIEKGMSNEKIRLGFGKRAFRDLFYTLDIYLEKKFDPKDDRFLNAINIIQGYVEYHEKHNFDVSEVNVQLQKYKKYCLENNENNIKARRIVDKDKVLQTINMPFDKFARSRMSVRNYSDESVDLNLITDAIEIASYTPSVCNRQPWKVYVIEDYEKIQRVMKVQKGLNDLERKGIPMLLAITVDTAYFSTDRERNEPFVDGGLFSMSLLYALHSKGLAACALNANMSNSELDEEKKIIKIKESERIIMFISVGYYKEKIFAPLSKRDGVDNYINIV